MNNHGNFIVCARRDVRVAGAAGRSAGRGDLSRASPPPNRCTTTTGRVIGVRIGDMGVAKDGSHKPGYTQGIDIRAKITVLAEGARGHLTKRLVQALRARRGQRSAELLDRHQGAVAGAGRARRRPARSCTRFGWPADNRHLRRQLPVPPRRRPHRARLRQRPRLPRSRIQAVRSLPAVEEPSDRSSRCSKAARILSAGARAIVTGGYQSLPKVEMPGALLIGDAAGLLNVPKIKGTHQAIRSGMLAAEHLARPSTARRHGLRREAARLDGDGRTAARCATSSPASRRACGSAC